MNLDTPNIPLLPVGLSYEVPKDRVLFQMATYSFANKGSIGIKEYLKQNGQTIFAVQTDNDIIPSGQFNNNNHPATASIVVEAGTVEVGLKNLSNNGKSIAFGASKVQNPKGINNAYVFYQTEGLKSTPYYKQVDPQRSYFFTVPVEAKNDIENYPEYQSGTLHKNFNANLIINGQIYTSEVDINYGDNNYYNYDGIKIKASGTTYLKLLPKADHSKFVALKIETFGYGQTGKVTVLEAVGCGVSANHLLITPFNFNYAYSENGSTVYQIRENFINQFYKMYNNEGYIIEATKSIEKAPNPKPVSTTATIKAKVTQYKYYILATLAALIAFTIYKTKTK